MNRVLADRLRVPPEAFVVANGKLVENAGDVYRAIVSRKLGIGFYDGTILPINLVDPDPKPFIACVAQQFRQLGLWIAVVSWSPSPKQISGEGGILMCGIGPLRIAR
jgi:hypothetical protein